MEQPDSPSFYEIIDELLAPMRKTTHGAAVVARLNTAIQEVIAEAEHVELDLSNAFMNIMPKIVPMIAGIEMAARQAVGGNDGN